MKLSALLLFGVVVSVVFARCMVGAEVTPAVRKCPEPNPRPVCDTVQYPELKPPRQP